jgi:hypothetical protein
MAPVAETRGLTEALRVAGAGEGAPPPLPPTAEEEEGAGAEAGEADARRASARRRGRRLLRVLRDLLDAVSPPSSLPY